MGRRAVGVGSGCQCPKVLWTLDFQFDANIEGKSVEIASVAR
ncbi:hypothetical protein I545_1465 [Mycobacterium kansasii 662]|uniref:Uncharacterized protein n=3 Tax=Mycobacterium kansasii TaxID=1768 RepID=A0A1V3WGL4_MYCKA|nr:hypothetical protein MKAN_26305 [Mycobacterium kansasii ATCC 12478]ETZ99815.1 hypothetical protein I547_5119 [Mycobacterium kansasii 824]EUA21024.1 hypothetical protein I545_1465 [Mycobacterium kansasii 662]KEP42490.1 hypothetical protein MKSMC1_23540 [Mycobacterium kansasii]OOK66117.1 hypothetical protein BZL29_7504 [Mycobacterium kansasii]